MDRKRLYEDMLLQEYRNMCRAMCRMVSYHEKLTTDGFELNDEDWGEINSVINKVDNYAIKRLQKWVGRVKN